MKKLITVILLFASISIYAGIYLVTDIKNKEKLTIKTGEHTKIIPVDIKNNKCVLLKELYELNKDTINSLKINYVIREVADDEFINEDK